MTLSKKQIVAAQLYGEATNILSLDEICQEVGTTRRTLYTWRQIPEWVAEAGRSTETTRALIRGPAFRCLMRAILDGDVSAARTALQATGDIGSGTNVITTIVNQPENTLAERYRKARQEYATDESTTNVLDRK